VVGAVRPRVAIRELARDELEPGAGDLGGTWVTSRVAVANEDALRFSAREGSCPCCSRLRQELPHGVG